MTDSPPDELLRRYLAERDGRCPACSYSLRGLQSDLCPECGMPLAIGVVMDHERIRYWRAAVIGCAMALGLGLSMLLAFFLLYQRNGVAVPPAKYLFTP